MERDPHEEQPYGGIGENEIDPCFAGLLHDGRARERGGAGGG
jgi:hypothetical protein